MAGHFQDHVHAGTTRRIHYLLVNVVFGGIENVVSLHLLRQLSPMVVDFQRIHFTGATGARHGNTEQANGPAADHRHRFGRNLSGQHRVHGVAQRIEHAGIIRWNARVNLPNI